MPRWVIGLSVLVIALVGILGARIWFIEPGCSGRIVETQTALARSDEELASVAALDGSARCKAIQNRVELLHKAASLEAVCGQPQLSKGELWRGTDAQMRAFARLAESSCSSPGMQPGA